MTSSNLIRGGVDRNASTLELFFDLVYVFAMTQVVGAVHHDPTIVGLVQGAFMIALLWWTWSVYTWTTNWTGTDGTATRLFLLAAMGATLFMALAVPTAFGDGARWFGISYFVVRMLAAGFYWVASKEYPNQRAAFFTFFPISFVAAALILVGGFLSGGWLWALWITSAILDLVSALNSGRGDWAIDAKHFAERNGLFIIIALGESIVGIGLTAAGVERDGAHTAAIALTFIIAAALWWSYFDQAAPYIEQHFASLRGKARGHFARDAYSILHYPLVVGIVFFAVAAEDIVAHPDEVLGQTSRIALTLGVALVLLSIVGTGFRAVRKIGIDRAVAAVFIIGAGIVGASLDAVTLTAIVAAIIVISLTWERRRPWDIDPANPIAAADSSDD